MDLSGKPKTPIAVPRHTDAMAAQYGHLVSDTEIFGNRPSSASPSKVVQQLKVGPWKTLQYPPGAHEPIVVTNYRAVQTTIGPKPPKTPSNIVSPYAVPGYDGHTAKAKDVSLDDERKCPGGVGSSSQIPVRRGAQTALSSVNSERSVTHNYANPTRSSTLRGRRPTICSSSDATVPQTHTLSGRLAQMRSQTSLRAQAPLLLTEQRADRHRRPHGATELTPSPNVKARAGTMRTGENSVLSPVDKCATPGPRKAESRQAQTRSPLKLKHLRTPNERSPALTLDSPKSEGSTTYFTARDEQDYTTVSHGFETFIDADNEDSFLHSTAIDAQLVRNTQEYHLSRQSSKPQHLLTNPNDGNARCLLSDDFQGESGCSDTFKHERSPLSAEAGPGAASETTSFGHFSALRPEDKSTNSRADKNIAQAPRRSQSTSSLDTAQAACPKDASTHQPQVARSPSDSLEVPSTNHDGSQAHTTKQVDVSFRLEDPFVDDAMTACSLGLVTLSAPQRQVSGTNNQKRSALPSAPSSRVASSTYHQHTKQIYQHNTEGSMSSPLRARAPTFIPEGPRPSEGQVLHPWQDLADMSYARYGPPPVEMLHPICARHGSQNGMKMVMPYDEGNQQWYQDAFGEGNNQMNYSPADAVYNANPVPWCTTMPRHYQEVDILGNEEYKLQVPDTSMFNALSTTLSQPAISEIIPSGADAQDHLNNRVLAAHLEEQKRGPRDIEENGPGPHPHTMPTFRPITEPMWMRPIGSSHTYGENYVYPNVRAKEWDDISTAIKVLNANNYTIDGKWWEPPIPMGFEKRAAFNHSRVSNKLPQPLRGGGTTEWDWVDAPRVGCPYCGDNGHEAKECGLLKLHRATDKKRCLSCNDPKHDLRDCDTLPQFDNTEPRYRKLQHYGHTQHWRKTLHQQHAKFAKYYGLKAFPALQNVYAALSSETTNN